MECDESFEDLDVVNGFCEEVFVGTEGGYEGCIDCIGGCGEGGGVGGFEG